MSSKSKSAIAVRPYGDHIRQIVFKTLQDAGLDVTAPPELVEGTNEELIKRLVALRADVLLIPFHAVRTGNDVRTNGLELLQQLRDQVAWTRSVPVVMPVSVFAKVAYEGAMRSKPMSNIMAVYEDELALPETSQRIAKFVATGKTGA